MENYIDKDYAVAGGTVLGYYGSEQWVNIPAIFGDAAPQSIGECAFMANETIERVVIPPGVKRIGKSAFMNCPHLSKVIIEGGYVETETASLLSPNLGSVTVENCLLKESEYLALKNSCKKTPDGIYFAAKFPPLAAAQSIKNALNLDPIGFGCNRFPDDAPMLLWVPCDTEFLNLGLHKEVGCIDFVSGRSTTTQHEALLEYISQNHSEAELAAEEARNDADLRRGKVGYIQRTMALSFDDNKTRHSDGYLVELTFTIGIFFCQSAKRVRVDGKDYYVYSRYFFTSSGSGLVRRDTAVYCGGMPVIDTKVRDKVYAKYKLLAIL